MELALAGYEVFVVGIGATETFATVLDGLAFYGQVEAPATEVPPSDDPYYFPADNADAINSAFESITNLVVDCEYEVNWSTVPDINEVTGEAVEKRCDSVNLTGTPTGGGLVRIYYSGVDGENPANCDNETEDNLGWYWVEMEGATFDDVTAAGSDFTSCARIQLCPLACNKMKTIEGVREWETVSASFGCEASVIPPVE